MHRMSGVDAAFLYDERPDEPQHTLKVAIWGREASAAYGLARTRRWLRSRLPDLPPLRWRAVRVPLDLHHPVWIEAGEPDLEHHVRRLAIPAPGGRSELCEVISEVASHPLDPERPLWELWMLEGYEGGRVAAVLKMSHALADGVRARALLETLYDRPPRDAPARLPREAVPSRSRLLRDALVDRLRDGFVHLPQLLVRTHAAFGRARRAGGEPSAYRGPRLRLLDSARTPFAGRPSRRRVFAFTTLSLDHAKQVRSAMGCTVNDVFLATAAGAVRRYLCHHRSLPGLPTLGHMAASIRNADDQHAWGNRITSRPIPLPTHIGDPLARLRAASAIATEMKRDVALRRGAQLEDWLRRLPPVAGKLLAFAMRTTVRVRPDLPCGVLVSSVRGPERTLYAPDGPIEKLVSVGHIKYGAGLNLTAWSHADQLNVGLYACPRAVPDLWRLADFVNEAFEELIKAVASASA